MVLLVILLFITVLCILIYMKKRNKSHRKTCKTSCVWWLGETQYHIFQLLHPYNY